MSLLTPRQTILDGVPTTDACENSRIADLEAVRVQNRPNRAICNRIETFVGLPGGREGAGFSLAVADDAGAMSPGVECGQKGNAVEAQAPHHEAR